MLWGLLALAVPVVVHLFNFRRPRVVLFSRAVLFSAIAQFVQRRLKLLRLLLLLLRLAVVGMLVVLFAGPVLRLSEGAQTAAESRVLILLDDSPSMQRTHELGPYWQQALQTAQAIIKQRTDGKTQFQVQPISGYRAGQPYVSSKAALAGLARQRISDNSTTTGQLFTKLKRDLQLSKQGEVGFASVVYLVSDFQQLMQADTAQVNWPQGTELMCVRVGGAQPALYVQRVSLADPILEVGKAPLLRVEIQNERSQAVPAATVRVVLEGSEVARGSVDLPAEGQAVVDIALPAGKPGWQTGQVLLDEASQGYAGSRHFTVYVPPVRKLLIAAPENANTYLKPALQTAYADASLTFITPRQLDEIPLANYNALILNGATEMSGGTADRIARWVHTGGGLLLFPPDDNMVNAEKGVGLLLQQLGAGSFSSVLAYEKPVEATLADRSHPLFKPIFLTRKDKPEQFESFAVRKLYGYQAPSGQVVSELVRTTNGHVVLAEVQCKKGRVFVASLPPTLAWSEWPVHHSFAPLIQRMASVLSQRSDTQLEYTLGQATEVRFATPRTDLIGLYRAEEQAGIPQQFAQNGEVLLDFGPLDLRAGVFRLVQRDSLLGKLAFNTSAQEASGVVATEPELRAYLAASGIPDVQFLQGKPEVVAAQATQLLGGIVLWKYFLIFVILILVAEGLIARYGVPVPKTTITPTSTPTLSAT